MRTIIKILMLLLTLGFIGINVLAFMVSGAAIRQSSANHDPEISSRYTTAQENLDAIVAERSLELGYDSETFESVYKNPETGETDADAEELADEVDSLRDQFLSQTAESAGATAGAGIFAGGMLCVSFSLYFIAMCILGVLYFVFKPNTSTVRVKHVR